MIVLTLPWPPSNNTYWRRLPNGRTLLSEKARKFRQDVQGYVTQHALQRMDGRLYVAIDVFPPDRRKRDLDNLPKGILDGLTHAGVIEDDSNIDHLVIVRREASKGGLVRVFINQMGEGDVQAED